MTILSALIKFSKYLFSAYYVLDIILSVEDIAINKRQSFLSSWNLNYRVGNIQ